MAESQTGDKTEQATPHKLRQAKEQGQVARSRDLAPAGGLLVGLKILLLFMPQWLHDFRELFRLTFVSYTRSNTLENAWSMLFSNTLFLLVKMLLPLFVIPLMISLASLFPGGWVFSPTHFTPQLKRLNPLTHLGRLVSANHASEMGKSIAKVLVLGTVLYYVSHNALNDFFALQSRPLSVLLPQAANLLMNALLALVAVFIAFALLDLPLQAYLFQREQRMSKQDIKEEYKSTEGRPEVKRRLRQLQYQFAQRSLRKAVPEADVVIVNPEHFAVALKYDDKRAEAPFIVAKGIDEMALYIRRLATEHGLEVVAIPPLARAVYYTTQVNQQIPAPLYRAVAQVLTYILQLKAFRRGQRASRPALPANLDVPHELAQPRDES